MFFCELIVHMYPHIIYNCHICWYCSQSQALTLRIDLLVLFETC